MRDAGYRVSVICPKARGFNKSHEILENIEIYRHRAWEASGKKGYLLEYPWALAAEFLLALRVFARTRFRILQACNPPDTIFLVALFFKLFGVRFIFDQHDPAPELFEAKFGRRSGVLYNLLCFFEFCSYRIADSCIATNDSFRQLALTRGKKLAKEVFVVRNSPDLSSFCAPRTAASAQSGKPYLVAYVGFMGSQDGLDLLLVSIGHIVRQRKDVHFVLVGGGSMLDDIRKTLEEKDLASYVTLTGQVAHEEVARWLAAADIGVAPDPKNGLNDKLTMIKILEYMAFSLPVVLFDLEEGRRIAESAALFARPNDPIDFAEQVTKLLDCPSLRRELGTCGRKRIEEKLNWATEKHSLLAAYSAALSQELA